MKDSKLIKVLKSLTKDEFKRLGLFVKSAYFNTDNNIVAFYIFLKSSYPQFNSIKLEKTKAFKSLFPKSNYNDGKMRNLLSKMYNNLELFLIELELNSNPIKREKLLIDALKSRNIEEEYKKKAINIIESLEAYPIKSEIQYLTIYTISQELYFYSNIITTHNPQDFLKKSILNLDHYYELSKLKLKAELLTIKISRSSSIIDDNALLVSRNIIVNLLSNIIELHESGNETLYLKIKKSFYNNIAEINYFDQKFILKHLIEFSIRTSRQNADRYYNETFDLYKIGHEHSLLATNNTISYTTFLNIVTIGARVKKFKWVENFINENELMLPYENRHEVSSLGFAYIFFYKKKYWEAINSVSDLKFKNKLYQLISKSISLQAFFELFIEDKSYYDLTYSYTQSFEKYIGRNPAIGKNRIVSYLSFIRLTRNLIDLIYRGEKSENNKNKLVDNLNNSISIVERKWLSEKISKHL